MKKLFVNGLISLATLTALFDTASAQESNAASKSSALAANPSLSGNNLIAPVGCDTRAYKPEQFEVAIDRATGIAFVHSPCGWSFMRVITSEAIAQGIKLASAKPVPRAVLAAEITLQPWLARYQVRQAIK